MEKIFENELLIIKQPSLEDKIAILDCLNEFIDNDLKFYGDGGLSKFANFEDWLGYLKQCASKNPPNNFVTSTQFITIHKPTGRVIGAINIRHFLNDILLKHGGHIGYSIRPSAQRQGFGDLQLQLALKFCKEIGLEKVLITCKTSNTASQKTILKNGGVLENILNVDGENFYRFWIAL